MVVCKFFQQGNCRFGQNCRFEHVYGSKYSYHAPSLTQNVAPTQPAECIDEQLVNQVQADIQTALQGGQWILSCYAPYKEKPNYPGINDLSPEEARLFIYEAKNSNNLEQAINYMNNLFKETRQKYEQLLQPNVGTLKLLRSLYKGELITSSFSNTGQSTFIGTNSASSIFRRAAQDIQPTAATIFSQGQQNIFNSGVDQAQGFFSKANVFGSENQNNSFAKSIFTCGVNSSANQFGATNQTDPSSLFSTANQNIFGPAQSSTLFKQTQNNSLFGQAQNISPFAQAQNTSPFSQTQNTSPFAQAQNVSSFSKSQNDSPFRQSQNTSPFSQGNIFQKTENPASMFGQANSQLVTANNAGIYSNIEELSEEDLEAFKSDYFELGFVPELPPPQQLCTRV